MKAQEAVLKLRACAPRIVPYGVSGLFLFGSTARDAAGERSDVDLFVDHAQNPKFNAFDLIDVKAIIENELGVAVDLTTRGGLHPKLRERIEREAVKVF